MIDLTRRERIILIVLAIMLAIGLGIKAYLAHTPPAVLTISRVDLSSASAGYSPRSPVNINSASVDELMRVRGIGPKMAQRIIDYRTAHGSFGSVKDLGNVPGIKDALLGRIKDDVCVE